MVGILLHTSLAMESKDLVARSSRPWLRSGVAFLALLAASSAAPVALSATADGSAPKLTSLSSCMHPVPGPACYTLVTVGTL